MFDLGPSWQEILDYWFKDGMAQGWPSDNMAKRWFAATADDEGIPDQCKMRAVKCSVTIKEEESFTLRFLSCHRAVKLVIVFRCHQHC